MKHVLILADRSEEAEPMIEQFDLKELHQSERPWSNFLSLVAYQGTAYGVKITLVRRGEFCPDTHVANRGPKHASICMQTSLARFQPDLVLCAETCDALPNAG